MRKIFPFKGLPHSRTLLLFFKKNVDAELAKGKFNKTKGKKLQPEMYYTCRIVYKHQAAMIDFLQFPFR